MIDADPGGCPHKEFTTYSGKDGIEYECNWCEDVFAFVPYDVIDPADIPQENAT